MIPPILVTLLRVFLPFAAGYFLSYLYRVVNAVIAANLLADMGIGPAALGLLTAAYLIAFASFQLPLGVLLDRFGPRRVEAILLLFAALGAAVFARAESLAGLATGRALIGFGVSSCLMAAMKAYTVWFSREKWPLVNGFQMAAGGFGALAATAPVEMALRYTDWRGVFLLLAGLTFLAAVVIFVVVPEKRDAAKGESLQRQLLGIRQIFTSRHFWRIAPLNTMSQASFLAIQGLWAGPWLQHVVQLDRAEIARVLFWVAAAMVAGFISFGIIAERLQRRGVTVATTAVVGMSLFMIVQALLLLGPVSWSLPLWLAFGYLGTAGVISYSALVLAFPLHLAGRVTTAINLLVFIAAFAGQWAIGAIIDFCSKAGQSSLSPTGFRLGFGLMLALQLVGLGYFIVSKPGDDADGRPVRDDSARIVPIHPGEN